MEKPTKIRGTVPLPKNQGKTGAYKKFISSFMKPSRPEAASRLYWVDDVP